MNKIIIGLERLSSEKNLLKKANGNIAYLSHAASVDKNFVHGVDILKSLFGDRLKKIFSPQHGFVSDVQDNMVESKDFFHPFYKLPVYSLYGETRVPTDKMLENIDTFIVDLQDVGTRVYTYISTLTLVLKKCAEKK